MPHIIVEYSENIPTFDQRGLLTEINQGLIDTGLVQAHDVKSRIQVNRDYLVGLGDEPIEQAYLHVQLKVLSGRSEAQKVLMQDQVLAALQRIKWQAQEECKHQMAIQLSAELIEMPKMLYRKTVV